MSESTMLAVQQLTCGPDITIHAKAVHGSVEVAIPDPMNRGASTKWLKVPKDSVIGVKQVGNTYRPDKDSSLVLSVNGVDIQIRGDTVLAIGMDMVRGQLRLEAEKGRLLMTRIPAGCFASMAES